ncbi:MAG: hypothetical protein ACJAU5_001236 [Maricaulis maris]|jgi:hypothetical protein|uniref:DUF4166 domain-containing protein n=1 Tax=Maricaulis maris (strain MCS10) TaxID=394221 RepID=Q0AKM8_MARMM|nr:DUF4166 domain-containing protein [Maricaulis maris]ABI67165.1 conserved hypothetical protein [Maricaulis maris MCS10]
MTHLYQALLGSDWSLLAPVTRALHSPDSTVLFEGTVDIVRGSRPLAPLIAGILGLPKAGRQQPALVKVSKSGAGELLERWYDGRHFSTWQGRAAGLLTERFGPFGLSFRLRLADEVLHFDRQGVTLWGIRLPEALSPRVVANERSAGDRHVFDVALSLPLVGLIVQYRGELVAATD